MIAAQTALEMRMSLRNGEQLLLTVLIPVLLRPLVAEPFLGTCPAGGSTSSPGVIALAVISTAFTGLAIGTGFERRYGVLKRLGRPPLPRWCADGPRPAVILVELLQVPLIGGGAGPGLAPRRARGVSMLAWWWRARPRSPGSAC